LAGVRARGASKKCGTPIFSAIVEASNFKIGTPLRFGEYGTITTLGSTELGRGWLGYRSTSKIVGITYSVPRTLYQLTAEV